MEAAERMAELLQEIERLKLEIEEKKQKRKEKQRMSNLNRMERWRKSEKNIKSGNGNTNRRGEKRTAHTKKKEGQVIID